MTVEIILNSYSLQKKRYQSHVIKKCSWANKNKTLQLETGPTLCWSRHSLHTTLLHLEYEEHHSRTLTAFKITSDRGLTFKLALDPKVFFYRNIIQEDPSLVKLPKAQRRWPQLETQATVPSRQVVLGTPLRIPWGRGYWVGTALAIRSEM